MSAHLTDEDDRSRVQGAKSSMKSKSADKWNTKRRCPIPTTHRVVERGHQIKEIKEIKEIGSRGPLEDSFRRDLIAI
jgi:hypothetical protein